MALPGLIPRRLPATSRWAVHAALLIMLVLALVVLTIMAGLIDLSPDGGLDIGSWRWRTGLV
jgi:hypothetical protein